MAGECPVCGLPPGAAANSAQHQEECVPAFEHLAGEWRKVGEAYDGEIRLLQRADRLYGKKEAAA